MQCKEPRVQRAHASVLAALGGYRITRLLFDLDFTDEQRIDITLKPGQTLQKVYWNQVAIPFEVDRPDVAFLLRPCRSRYTAGKLELVLVEASKDFQLNGSYAFLFPKLSWPIGEFFLDLYLPETFEYNWVAGDFDPIDWTPRVQFTHGLEMSGRCYCFDALDITDMHACLIADYELPYELGASALLRVA